MAASFTADFARSRSAVLGHLGEDARPHGRGLTVALTETLKSADRHSGGHDRRTIAKCGAAGVRQDVDREAVRDIVTRHPTRKGSPASRRHRIVAETSLPMGDPITSDRLLEGD